MFSFKHLFFSFILLSLFNYAPVVVAQPLANLVLKDCSLSLEFGETQSSYKLNFNCPEPLFREPQTISAFTLESPIRLVVDLTGLPANLKENLILNSDELSSLRIGTHENKTRIVLDIKTPTIPLYSMSKGIDGKSFILDFSLANPKQIAPQDKDKYSVNLRGDESIVQPTKVPEPTINSDNREAAINMVLTPQPSKLADGRNELRAVLFKSIGIPPRGGILFELKNSSTYSLNREANNRYKLILENTRLAENHLLLPQYAPSSVDGLEIVILREEGKNIIATIYTKEHVSLAPYIVNGKLWVKVNN